MRIQQLKLLINSKLSKDLVYVFISQLVIMLSAFLINKIVSVRLGVEGFAQYSLIKKSAYLFNSIMTGGMLVALPRYLARHTRKTTNIGRYLFPSSIFVFLFYIVVLGFVILIFPDLFSQLLFNEEGSYSLLLITFFMALAQSYGMIIYAFFQGHGNFKRYNRVQMIFNLVLLLLSLITSSNIFRMIFVSHLGVLVYLFFITKKGNIIHPLKSFNRKIIWKTSEILAFYGFPRMLQRLVLLAQNIFPVIIILHRLSLTDVGIFSAGIAITSLISPIFGMTGGVLLQRVSLYYKNNKIKLINKVLSIALLSYLLLSSIGVLLIVSFKGFLIPLMFSKEFNAVESVLWIFAISLVPQCIFQLLCNPIDAMSKIPFNLITISVSTIVLFTIILFANSIYDCALAYLISNIVTAFLTLIFWVFVMRKAVKSNNDT